MRPSSAGTASSRSSRTCGASSGRGELGCARAAAGATGASGRHLRGRDHGRRPAGDTGPGRAPAAPASPPEPVNLATGRHHRGGAGRRVRRRTGRYAARAAASRPPTRHRRPRRRRSGWPRHCPSPAPWRRCRPEHRALGDTADSDHGPGTASPVMSYPTARHPGRRHRLGDRTRVQCRDRGDLPGPGRHAVRGGGARDPDRRRDRRRAGPASGSPPPTRSPTGRGAAHLGRPLAVGPRRCLMSVVLLKPEIGSRAAHP